jgi:hypothetical protein
VDEATWAALAAALTVLGIVWTVVAFRRRGAANGLRALGFTLLPAAAWLTGTLEMFTEIAGSVLDWATRLVLNPVVWTGIGLAGASLLLLGVSAWLRDRQLARGQGRTRTTPAETAPGRESPQLPTGGADDESDEIEEILRRRGIR